MIDDQFYFAFEERFREPEVVITNRLLAYLPLLKIFEGAGRSPTAYDYNIGRGEWLRLLASRGWDAHGIDPNESIAVRAMNSGMNVEIADALEHIRSIPDKSVSLISGFHLAEHFTFEVLFDFIKEAQRVLISGGILILETPNPENILVGSSRFYYDPMRIEPLPPKYLQFLAEYLGFKTAEVIGFNASNIKEVSALATGVRHCMEIPDDYSLIAQKDFSGVDEFVPSVADIIAADMKCQTVLGDAASASGALIKQFSMVDGWRIDMQQCLREVKDTNAAFEDDLSYLKRQNARLSESVLQLHESAVSRVLKRAEDSDAALHSAQAQLQAVYTSTSWRITKPLRCFSSLVRAALRGLTKKKEVVPQPVQLVQSTVNREAISDPGLTPHANFIYSNLKSAIEQKKLTEEQDKI
jgi:O-antigen chain-terminating methyltransferase